MHARSGPRTLENTHDTRIPAAELIVGLVSAESASARVRRGMSICSLGGGRARQPRCGRAGRAAYESHVLSLRWHLVYLDPLRELVLGLSGGELGQHLYAYRLCGCLYLGDTFPCHRGASGNVYCDSNVSQSRAYDHTMHLSPCFQLAGVARLCNAVSCNESSTRRTCVRERARAGVKERATGRVKVEGGGR